MRFNLQTKMGFLGLALAGALALMAQASAQNLPARNVLMELRQIDATAAGYSVSTRPAVPLQAPQQVQVRNGDTARVGQTSAQPQTWIKEVQAEGQNSGAGVKQELIWFQSGQTLQLRPVWTGGRQAEVEVQWLGENVNQQPGQELPAQQSGQLRTTVLATLGQWVTLAKSGTEPERGVYRSDASAQAPRLLQLRVTVLP
jgi:hypothetical protein